MLMIMILMTEYCSLCVGVTRKYIGMNMQFWPYNIPKVFDLVFEICRHGITFNGGCDSGSDLAIVSSECIIDLRVSG